MTVVHYLNASYEKYTKFCFYKLSFLLYNFVKLFHYLPQNVFYIKRTCFFLLNSLLDYSDLTKVTYLLQAVIIIHRLKFQDYCLSSGCDFNSQDCKLTAVKHLETFATVRRHNIFNQLLNIEYLYQT